MLGNPPGTIQRVPRLFCKSITWIDWNSVEYTPLLIVAHALLNVSDHFFWNSHTFHNLPLRSKATISHASQFCASHSMITLLYGCRELVGVRSTTAKRRKDQTSFGMIPLGP